jgi:small subunit ribosomal protein S20
MAHHKSAIKRIRQTETKTARNRYYRTRIKNITKDVLSAVAENNQEEAQKSMKIANQELHSLVSKGVLKKNTVARKVSRLQLKVNALNNA